VRIARGAEGSPPMTWIAGFPVDTNANRPSLELAIPNGSGAVETNRFEIPLSAR
jgi:hypothetical protein